MDTFFGNVFFLVVGKAKDLISARIGKDWAMPVHELMKSTGLVDNFWGWTKPEMVSVCENNACAAVFYLFRAQGFYGCLGADRHEHWCFVFLLGSIRSGKNCLAVSRAGFLVFMD